MSLITLIVTLFLIMDSVGNISTFLRMMHGIPLSRQRYVLMREMGIALGVMVLFNYIGEFIFSFLNLSNTAVMLSAGMILFLTALKTLFSSKDSPKANVVQGEPFVVPLAIPLIASPALLATIMILAKMEASQTMMLFAILIAWIASLVILLFASTIKNILGNNGLIATERLLALILVMIAIQRFMDGIRLFTSTYVKH